MPYPRISFHTDENAEVDTAAVFVRDTLMDMSDEGAFNDTHKCFKGFDLMDKAMDYGDFVESLYGIDRLLHSMGSHLNLVPEPNIILSLDSLRHGYHTRH